MHELILSVPQAAVERLGDALTDDADALPAGEAPPAQALAVSVVDADAGTDAEQPLFGEPGLPAPRGGWLRSALSALYASEDEATAVAAWVLARHGDDGVAVRALQAVPDADWVRVTQSQFAPAEAERVIRLDPGLAFGTGTHPTTRMCLRWIAHRAAAAPLRGPVLDYGCGSGILAIAAALHGAHGVVAVDIDEAAVRATRDNAAANGVTLARVGLPDAAGVPGGAHPLVLANILATPLKLLAPMLCAHVAPGGDLVLAGILERQADELRAAYAPAIALDVADAEDGWILMTGRRPADDRPR